MSVLVIAEPGMTWDRDLSKAFRLIDAAKACGADVCKFQWTSSGRKIQERRQVDLKYVAIYERGVQYPREWLEKLKARCESVGLEFMVTTYLIEDIAVVAPLVKRFKVSAYESGWPEFLAAHGKAPIIISLNPNKSIGLNMLHADMLYCVSKYPTKLEDLHFAQQNWKELGGGISDHTANVLTGAAAVATGASIVEAHIKLHDTPESNPDYPHSLVCDWTGGSHDAGNLSNFGLYVSFIRTVERML